MAKHVDVIIRNDRDAISISHDPLMENVQFRTNNGVLEYRTLIIEERESYFSELYEFFYDEKPKKIVSVKGYF